MIYYSPFWRLYQVYKRGTLKGEFSTLELAENFLKTI